jgi:hypothetical protein
MTRIIWQFIKDRLIRPCLAAVSALSSSTSTIR